MKKNKKLTSQETLVDTGERMVPEFHKGKLLYGEHLIRYEALLALVTDKVVMDIACGSGYGSRALSKTAEKVYGIDVDKEAIKYAKNHYAADNIKYLQGDGVKIPLSNNSVDVAISFETIEHIEDYDTFIKEIVRVLKKDGIFILSTPNELESPPGNHYHVHEFTYPELTSLLKKRFKNVTSYFQGTWYYTALFNSTIIHREGREKIDTINLSPLPTDKTMYFFFVCTNGKPPVSLPPLAAISEHWSAKSHQKELKKINDQEKAMRNHMDAQRKVIEDLDNHGKALSNQIAYLESRIAEFKKSVWWQPHRISRRVSRSVSRNKKK